VLHHAIGQEGAQFSDRHLCQQRAEMGDVVMGEDRNNSGH
jgi:hypothetical protein